MPQAKVLTELELKRALGIIAGRRHAGRDRLALLLTHWAGIVAWHARLDHLLIKSQMPEMLHAPHPDGNGARMRIDGGSGLHQGAMDASLGKISRKRQPDAVIFQLIL